jgi:4-amino-4-deoxy-L-arabinose transferase-like glycosyltransferase
MRKDSLQNPSVFNPPPSTSSPGWTPWLWLVALAAIFLFIEFLVPLGSAIKLGADEDFEFSKALLYLKGFHFYSEVWNDEPPLYPYLLAHVVQHFSFSILAARLMAVGFGLLLLGSLFSLSLNLGNLRTSVCAVALLIASPGFLDLASSCMVEIPTVAFVVATFALLSLPGRHRWPWLDIGAGVLFGIALQMKVIAVIYLPLIVLMLWLRHRLPLGKLLFSALVIGGMAVVTFAAINAMTGCLLWLQLQQAWASHFAGTKSFEYGSPADYAFDWKLLLKNWDIVVPVILGVGFFARRIRAQPLMIFPLAWLALTLAIVSTHKPWWASYYLHNTVPLCWCAAIALDAALAWAGNRRIQIALIAIYLLGAGAWMGMRIYLEITRMRSSPRLFNSLVLSEINRYKPFTKFMFTTEGVYSFHSGIPLPPQLGEISLKRLWSGDMTNAKWAADIAAVKPGVILVANQTQILPYQDVLQAEYRLVYEDNEHRLYALKSLIRQVPR